MKFDVGEVLTRAWKITWQHKLLWAISILPFFTMFLFLPFWLVIVFQENVDFDTMSTWMQNPVYMSIAIIVYLIIFAASIFLQIASRSSLTLGIYRAEAVIQPITFVDLLRNGFQYFWRMLGIAFLIGVGTMAVFIAFFVVVGLLSAVTMGLAALCIQPLFILMIPMFFFMVHNLEAGLDFNNMIRIQAVFGVVILPLMVLIQGFSLTYMKSAMMLTYLRLTRPSQMQPLPGSVEAAA